MNDKLLDDSVATSPDNETAAVDQADNILSTSLRDNSVIERQDPAAFPNHLNFARQQGPLGRAEVLRREAPFLDGGRSVLPEQMREVTSVRPGGLNLEAHHVARRDKRDVLTRFTSDNVSFSSGMVPSDMRDMVSQAVGNMMNGERVDREVSPTCSLATFERGTGVTRGMREKVGRYYLMDNVPATAA